MIKKIFDGKYGVTFDGQVWSMPYTVFRKNGKPYSIKMKEIAILCGVQPSTISMITTGKNWRNLK